MKPAIWSFLVPPVGWAMLLTAKADRKKKKQVFVASMLWWAVATAVAPFLPKPEPGPAAVAASAVSDGPSRPERSRTEPAAPPAPSGSPPRASDPRLMVPPVLPGFALMAEGPFMLNATRTADGAPLRTVQVIYRATDRSGLTAKLMAQISPDEVPTGRKYKQFQVGGHAAALGRDTDTGNSWVMWRNDPWHYYLLVRGGNRKAKRTARKVAPKLARAVAAHANPAVAGLDEAERTKRVAEYEEALSSPESLAAVQQQRLEAFASRLPRWAVSAQLGPGHGEVTVTVRTVWLALRPTIREEQARALWKEWAFTNTPTDLDKSSLRLVTGSGKVVGGSRAIAGSSIWVAR